MAGSVTAGFAVTANTACFVLVSVSLVADSDVHTKEMFGGDSTNTSYKNAAMKATLTKAPVVEGCPGCIKEGCIDICCTGKKERVMNTALYVVSLAYTMYIMHISSSLSDLFYHLTLLILT